jgi:hypothetical protein
MKRVSSYGRERRQDGIQETCSAGDFLLTGLSSVSKSVTERINIDEPF